MRNERRWQAITGRDRSADGRFVYAVRTTGVFCRPWCPSRRPRRENVEFFDSAADARRAGYRPCRRCRPDEHAAPSHKDDEAIVHACRELAASGKPVDTRRLARATGLSVDAFTRRFKSATGITPRAFALATRAARTRSALSAKSSVTAAMYSAGFSSPGRFYENAGRLLGMKPSAFRAGGAGETIRFAVGKCALGAILAAGTAQGICWIALGDDPNRLVRDFRTHFHRAELIGSDTEFARKLSTIISFIENPAGRLDLPLDVRGTAFQHRVWQALQKIPAGTTRTYTEIAHSLGLAKGARAVARACASNPVAVAIPCHRVVRSDQSISGYRWGIERKRALLKREQVGRASDV